MHYLYCPLSVNGAPFIAKITVEEYGTADGKRAYNLQKITMSDLQRAQFSKLIDENHGKFAYKSDALTVAQLYGFVKKYDKDFTAGKTVNKKLLNPDGTPKAFYHGTNEEFSVFDKTKSQSAAYIVTG